MDNDAAGNTSFPTILVANSLDVTKCSQFQLDYWPIHCCLWLSSAPYLIFLSRRERSERNTLFQIVYIIRILLVMIILIATMIQAFVYLSSPNHHSGLLRGAASAGIGLFSQVMILSMVTMELWKGLHPPIIPTIFWGILICTDIGTLRAVILQSNNRQNIVNAFPEAACLPQISLLLCNFLYCFIFDYCIPTKMFMPDTSKFRRAMKKKRIFPFFWSSLLARTCFFHSLVNMFTSIKKELSLGDIFDYPPGHDSKGIMDKFSEWFNKKLEGEKYLIFFIYLGYIHTLALFPQDSLMTTQDREHILDVNSKLLTHWMIFWGIFKLTITPSFVVFLPRVLALFMNIFTLYALRDLLHFIESDDSDTTWGIVLACRLLVIVTLQSWLQVPWLTITHYTGAQIQGTLSALVMTHFVKLPPTLRRKMSSSITSFLTVDVHRAATIFSEANYAFQVFILVIPGTVLLYQLLGLPGLTGMVMIVILIAVNILITLEGVHPLKEKEMKARDKRIKLLQNTLRGMKVLKSYTWEKVLMKKILKERTTELSYARKAFILQGIGETLAMTAHGLAISLMLTVYVLSSSSNSITAARTFSAITVLSWFAEGCTYVPNDLFYIIQGQVSLARVLDFLKQCLELQHMHKQMGNKTKAREKTHTDKHKLRFIRHDSKNAVKLKDASLSWYADTPVLKSITLNVPRGELLAVVGEVGSGKTSLISALLGELNLLSGNVCTQKMIAYTSQEAWIYSATLRDNILFGQPYNISKYNAVIKACALDHDFELLPQGDLCEVGNKGTSLSGGQKHRVSLARAVYSDADLYLLDDPLSAVDRKVSDHIFQEVIGPTGLLRFKTRIIATHNMECLSEVDKLIVLSSGSIVEKGTYNELISSQSFFIKNLENFRKEKPNIHTSRPTQDKNMPQNGNAEERFIKDTAISYKHSFIHAAKVYIQSGGIIGMILVCLGCLIFAVIQVSCDMWIGYWSKEWQTNKTLAAENTHYRLGVFVTLAVTQSLTVFGTIVLLVTFTITAGKTIFEKLLERVFHAEVTDFDYLESGMILNWFTKDTDTIDMLPIYLIRLAYYLSHIVALMISVAYVVPVAYLILIPVCVVYVIMLFAYSLYLHKLLHLDSVTKSPLFSRLNEFIQGIVSIETYGRTENFLKAFYHLTDNSSRGMWNFSATKGALRATLVVVEITFSFLVNLICIFYRFSVDRAIASMCVYVVYQCIEKLKSVLMMMSMVAYSLIAVERVSTSNLLHQEAPWYKKDVLLPSNWPHQGSIEFRCVNAKYRGSTNLVLKGISFTIKPQEKIGIVGRTGAGKTSLTAVILQMMEISNGTVLIDGINIETIGLHQLRSRISVITQDPILFEGSLRENLDPCNDYGDPDIWRALGQAHLQPIVEKMPHGLATQCLGQTTVLSLGQRQLLCLARALLHRTKILILDEPTASVDVHTDQLVQHTLRTSFKTCTVLTIAHRISTILDYNRVFVMQNGAIVESGDPMKLLADEISLFYKTVNKSSE